MHPSCPRLARLGAAVLATSLVAALPVATADAKTTSHKHHAQTHKRAHKKHKHKKHAKKKATVNKKTGAQTPAKKPVTPATPAPATSSLAVTFHVVNQNRSKAACPADGKAYDVVGHLTGPTSTLAQPTISSGTLYVHGDAVDESLWNYSHVAGYDYTGALAKDGFVSVSIQRLGYGSSGRPNGKDVCLGSEADVTHQIIGQLRAGTYTVTGATAPKFSKLALAGHSAAGYIVQDEAYSFHDIDALVVVASGEFPKPAVATALAGQQVRCASSKDGYALLDATDAEAAGHFFHDADPAVVQDVVSHRPPDSCAGLTYAPVSMAADIANIPSVTVPVLAIAGADDAFFLDPHLQAGLYSGSKDATGISVPDTGHAVTLGHSAPLFRADMEQWLGARGFRAG